MGQNDGPKKIFRLLGMIFATGSIVLIGLSATVPWGTLQTPEDFKLGPIPVSLNAQLYEYGVNYEADLSGAGGIMGGLGGGSIPSKMSDKRVFLGGLGSFQDTIGFVKGSAKEKALYITSYTWPPPENGTSECRVTTGLKSIPWWPVGLEQDAYIKVEFQNGTNVSELKVNKVWFELHRTVNGQDQYKKVWEATPADSLTTIGQFRIYNAKILVEEDLGEFSIVGRVYIEMRDTFGHSNKVTETSYRELAPTPSPIKLWTMGGDKSARIALLVTAFPLSIAGACLLGVSIPLGMTGRRYAWQLALAGSILAILAVGFYASGVSALMDLTGYGGWFSWTALFPLAGAGAAIGFASVPMFFLTRPPSIPKKAQKTVDGKAPEKGKLQAKGEIRGKDEAAAPKKARTRLVKKGSDTTRKNAEKAASPDTGKPTDRPVREKPVTNKYNTEKSDR